MIVAMAVIGVIDNYVIRIAEVISVWQFHLVRSTLALPLLCALPFLGLGQLWPRDWRAVINRSLLIASAMVLYFASLGFLPIAQALAGMFTSPIFIQILTALGLRRVLGPWRILAAILGFGGTLLVLQPDPNAFEPLILMPLGAGFLYACSSLYTRERCAGESTVALLTGSWIAMGALGAVGLIWLWLFPMDTPPGADGFLSRGWVTQFGAAMPWIWVQIIGSIIGVFLLTKAYQIGETTYVSVFEYSVMIFGPAWAWMILGSPLGTWQLSGIALIILAGIIIALRSGKGSLAA